jgi:hypothetical protein
VLQKPGWLGAGAIAWESYGEAGHKIRLAGLQQLPTVLVIILKKISELFIQQISKIRREKSQNDYEHSSGSQ